MTIDVEDYFHVSVFDGVVPAQAWTTAREPRVPQHRPAAGDLCRARASAATFFVLGWVAERFPDLVKRIAAAGHEIASHGYGHRLVYDQTRKAFREDVRRAKTLLEDACGGPVHGYRAPSYSIVPRSLWALDVLIEEGYSYDASIFPDASRSLWHPRVGTRTRTRSRESRARSSRRPDRRRGSARSTFRSQAAGTSACFRTGGRSSASIA